MKEFTICFSVSGGITIKAETEAEARAFFDSERGQEMVWREIADGWADITAIFEEEIEEDIE